MKRNMYGVLLALLLGLTLSLLGTNVFGACTNILVGKNATTDGSTIGTYCCDGARYANVVVEPREKFRAGAMMPIYFRPYASNYQRYLEYLEQEEIKGYIPQVRQTYRYVSLRVWYDDQRVGGINEHGLTTGETTIGGRSELRNSKGLLFAYSNYKESSLLTLALQRAKTAREAVRIMGSLAEEFGYAQTGEHISVTDGNEAWAFEIFGPGSDWTPESGRPGAVWCAQRIPDGHVGVSANRSRIGEVPLEENDYFMFSPNIRSLALENSWWNGAEPFVWYAAYGPSTGRGSMMREWRALSLVAPSLGLLPPDPTQGVDTRYPFSVAPENLVSVQDIMAVHRDTYVETEFDLTEDPAFYYENRSGELVKSPMANPFGPTDLFNLLGISAERSIGTASSVFSYVSQVTQSLPDPIKGCMWLGFGPAVSTCYVPVYSGTTELPESWGQTELTHVNRDNAWWAFNLVDQLPLIKWQNAIAGVEAVRAQAEASLFVQQFDFEQFILDLYSGRRGAAADQLATKLTTKYTNDCMNAVADGYWRLVDYLLFTFYSRVSSGAPQALPAIDCPPYPTNPGKAHGKDKTMAKKKNK